MGAEGVRAPDKTEPRRVEPGLPISCSRKFYPYCSASSLPCVVRQVLYEATDMAAVDICN